MGYRWFVIVSLAFVVSVLNASAQAQQEQPIFRSGVDLIEIDVTVIDRDGFPVEDLVATEFSVEVDGDMRRVVQAQYISLRPPEIDDPSMALETQQFFYSSNAAESRGRIIVIAVDTESILFGEGRHVMQAASEFVSNLNPRDRVKLIGLPPPGVEIDFSSNHERVREALEGMSGLGQRPQIDLNIGIWEADQIVEWRNDRILDEVILRECGGGTELNASCAFRVREETNFMVQDMKANMFAARRALEDVLLSLREMDGPKSVVWISGGLPVGRNADALRDIEELASASRSTLYVMMVDGPLIDMSQQTSSASSRDDRRLMEGGLFAVAAFSRGELFRVHENARPLFDRLEQQLSGYYLLGVEAGPTDRDEERRRISVKASRDGARVRARREVTFESPSQEDTMSVDEHIARMLRSPVSTTELPLKVATYKYLNPDISQSRILVAAEIGGSVDLASDLTIGYFVSNLEGRIVSSRRHQVAPTLTQTSVGPVLEYSLPIVVAPGSYSLRLAVVDGLGGKASVEHPLHVGGFADGPLTFGDLMVADRPESSGGLLPSVEPRVSSGILAMYTEIYAQSSEVFENTRVYVDVADSVSGQAKAYATAALRGPSDGLRRSVSADVSVNHLPPGQYVARARVVHDSVEVARLFRPFHITQLP